MATRIENTPETKRLLVKLSGWKPYDIEIDDKFGVPLYRGLDGDGNPLTGWFVEKEDIYPEFMSDPTASLSLPLPEDHFWSLEQDNKKRWWAYISREKILPDDGGTFYALVSQANHECLPAAVCQAWYQYKQES